MSLALLPAAARADQPWKNGGGVTREIAAWPPGADLAGFEWRISTATVAAAGPFSNFPGVDRILLVLAGGLALRIDSAPMQVLRSGDPPLAFPGDVPVEAELTDGPVTDLNIMVRRGVWTAEARRMSVLDPMLMAATGEIDFVITLGPAQVEGLDAPMAYADAARFTGGIQVTPAAGPLNAIQVSLSRLD